MNRLLTAMLLTVMTALALPALAAEASDAAPADWTVLIYMCGSDMETNSGMATYNLREIMGSVLPEYDTRIDVASGKLDRGVLTPRINVAVETGGAAPAGPAALPHYVSVPPESEPEEQMIEPESAPAPENLSIRKAGDELIERALARHGGKVKPAAAELGISERTIYRKLAEWKNKGRK